MRRLQLSTLLTPLVAACASAGGVPPAPVTWPPGSYHLEATVSYDAGIGTQRDTYSADLRVEPDGSTVTLDSHAEGVCRDPTAPELERDRSRGVRTFQCGDLTFELRPGRDTVSGELSAVVQESYVVTTCLRYGADGQCAQTHNSVRSREVTERATLRVRRVQ